MKILVVGCGYIGEIHLKILKKYGLTEVAVCENNINRLKTIQTQYNIEESYHDINQVPIDKFDGAIICTPNNLHAEHAIRFMEFSPGIMVEKPMAHTVEDAKKMLLMAEKHKKFIQVAYRLRFYEPYIKMKKMITEGDLGDVFSMRAIVSSKRTLTDAFSNYREKREFGGGIIHDYSHEIDYSKWFLEEKVKNIYSQGFCLKHKEWNTFDTADIVLIFENSKTSSIHLDYIQPVIRRSVEIYGTKGTLLWEHFKDIKFYSDDWAKWYEIRIDNDQEKSYLKQLQHYIKCIKYEEEPIVTGYEGLDVMKIIEGCINSSDNNKIVKL